jgi:prepilin-type N-terminal cleavage/methylation domain-containing protein
MSVKRHVNNNGFTLVELIVVLVILAILAAILIPALIGYIDRAKDEQDVLNAKNCLNAAQAEITELYGKTGGEIAAGDSIIPSAKVIANGNQDIDASGTDFAKDVFKTADLTGNEPYLLMVGVGSNATGASSTSHSKYTVYYVCYVREAKSRPQYFYCGTWTDINPRKGESNKLIDKNNVIQLDEYKGTKLQYILLSNKTGKNFKDGAFWTLLKGLS